jgi:D-arabinose 1-dehydrogenase-like Zn-dependent alcohol dehydrogenase
MKAVQVSRPGGDFQIVDRPVPQPGLNEVLVQVEACGVCHGDALVKEGGFPGLTYPRVPGHEIVGRVTELGPGVHEWSVGARVGVGWHGGHCWRCSACRRGDFGACESALTTGLSTDGGYGEFTVVRSEVAVALPEDLPATVLAPLLCAGNVTFSALRDAGVGGGDLVAIHGLGGLGHLAVQYATRLGCRTVVLSRGKSKEPLAYQLGAHSYIDTDETDPVPVLKTMGGAQLILSTAPNARAISKLVDGLAHSGRLTLLAFTREPLELPGNQLLVGGRSVAGWVGGNVQRSVAFSLFAGVRPIVEEFPLERAGEAYEKMMSSTVHFRAVLCPTLAPTAK